MCKLLSGKFLDINEIIKLLLQKSGSCPSIPKGLKENVYFVIVNEKNKERRQYGKKSDFSDDCGVWMTSRGASPKTTYLVNDDQSLKKVFVRNGQYCFEKCVDKKRKYIPLDPQPSPDKLLVIQRYYASLQSSSSYKKRVTWIESLPSVFSEPIQHLAVCLLYTSDAADE